MGLFDSNSSSERDNTGQNSTQDNNSGVVNYGGTVVNRTTDHGSVAAGIELAQSGLAVTNNAVLAALNANGVTSAASLDFGSKALDFASYAQDGANDLAKNSLGLGAHALDTIAGKFSAVTTDVLSAGQAATSQALDYAKQFSQSESKNSSDLMIKAVTAIAIVAVIGFSIKGRKS